MTEETIEDWNNKLTITHSLERSDVLLQLRYQLAFGIMVLIAGVWTVLGPLALTGENNKYYILLGSAISFLLIGAWRFFTHIIFEEELAWFITSLWARAHLGLITNTNANLNDKFNNIENFFGLKNDPRYRAFSTLRPKLIVMKNLQYHIPEWGILRFDCLSIAAIFFGGIFLIFSGDILSEYFYHFILVFLTSLFFASYYVFKTTLHLKRWTDSAINNAEDEMKKADQVQQTPKPEG
jgi:hypothetical protein